MKTLVIGYGNPQRGDDGLGPMVGEAIAAERLPGVHVVAPLQLAPELIEAMKLAERVLFIDAALPGQIEGPFAIGRVVPARSGSVLGHQETPAGLLALMRELEGRCPEAWLLAVAGSSFDFSERLSESGREHAEAALHWIRGWLTA